MLKRRRLCIFDRPVISSPSDIDLLHEIGSRLAAADPLHDVLSRVVDVVSTLVHCDSCFVYVLQDEDLVLRASKTPHPDVVDRLTLRDRSVKVPSISEYSFASFCSRGA